MTNEVKKSAGDLAIENSVKAGASNATFLKALWSIRGDLKVRMGSRLVPVVKNALVNELKAADGDKPAGLLLVPIETGGYEVRERVVKRAEKPVEAAAE